MYLKRLDVLGFKSFATRTTFEFGQGITAIVGPNGSGKSNIADALRWVLGEQSGRLLRARKLDDIIYAGSGKRSPADKVEVVLTLDNTDGWLPVDFADVAIARRGYRSGETEYLINRKRVRLRDLQQFLLRARAGQNSYAIIGQGLVETTLNLRPEERRQLIEEAADIGRYRLKIEDAQGKLAATHENVERVKLLIKEIAPRLGQLERQAKRAGEHASLSQELGQALRAYYEHQWRRAQEALAVSRAAHDQAQAEFTQARVALETCQRELADVTERLDEYRQKVSASAAERDRIEQRLREVEQRLAVAGDRRSILEARQSELREELAAVEGERDRAKSLAAREDGRQGEIEAAVAAARKTLEARQADLGALDGEFRDAQSAAGDAEARAKRQRAAAAELKTRGQRLVHSRRELERDLGRLETRRRSLVSQMAEQLRLLQGFRAQEAQILAETSRIGGQREALELELEEGREALSKVEANQNTRRGRLEALEARLTALEDARRQFEAAQTEAPVSLEGALAALYEVIRVPRGLESAIAATLSEYLEAFVFPRQADALAALQALVAERGPRVTVLPLDAIKQVYPLNLMREKGVLGVASQLVRFAPQYERLVDALLGRTIVVQDVQTAVRILRRGLGTVVTLDGIVFHPSGSITAGQPQTSRPFVLGYDRDIESIPKEIDRIRRSLAITEREADTLRDRLRRNQAAVSGLDREADDLLERRIRLHGVMSQRQQVLAQLRGEIRGLMMARAGLLDQQRGLSEEAERMEQEREAALAEAKEADESGRHLSKANVIVDQKRETLLRAVSDAAAEAARLNGELRSLSAEQEAAGASLARLEAQASAKALQLHGLEMELTALASSVQSDRTGLEQARGQLESLLQAAAPGDESAHHLEARQRDLHSQVLASQGRLFEAERRVLEAEADVRRWRNETDNLRVRIEEDGLNLTPDGDVLSPETFAAAIPPWLAAQDSAFDRAQDRPDEGPGGLRPISGGAEIDPHAVGRQIERLRAQIRALGAVNIEAQADYQSLKERHDFLAGQLADLEGAEHSLHRAIGELNGVMHKRFQTTYDEVARGFEQYFKAFFGGGHARLALTGTHDLITAGVEIEAQPPGKRTQNLAQLSGGEKALTAVALLFALLQHNPSPFCVLDEVDAMLDEANVGRFVSALQELAKRTQFIVITHNRRTIEVADSIYGISMGPDAASRVLSLRLADVNTGE